MEVEVLCDELGLSVGADAGTVAPAGAAVAATSRTNGNSGVVSVSTGESSTKKVHTPFEPCSSHSPPTASIVVAFTSTSVNERKSDASTIVSVRVFSGRGDQER